MACRTGPDEPLVATTNWKPVDLNSVVARYWPVCREAPSTRIFWVARAGAPGIGWLGQRVKTPGRTCNCWGSGIIAGVAAKVGAASKAEARPTSPSNVDCRTKVFGGRIAGRWPLANGRCAGQAELLVSIGLKSFISFRLVIITPAC